MILNRKCSEQDSVQVLRINRAHLNEFYCFSRRIAYSQTKIFDSVWVKLILKLFHLISLSQILNYVDVAAELFSDCFSALDNIALDLYNATSIYGNPCTFREKQALLC